MKFSSFVPFADNFMQKKKKYKQKAERIKRDMNVQTIKQSQNGTHRGQGNSNACT